MIQVPEQKVERLIAAIDALFADDLVERAILYSLKDGAVSEEEFGLTVGRSVKGELNDLVARGKVDKYRRHGVTFYRLSEPSAVVATNR